MTARNNRTIQGTEHLNKAAVFAAVAEHGSFSGAARAFGIARSTVSEHVSGLEEALGARLLERTTRRLRLTEEGELLLEHLSVALGAWQDGWVALQERRAEPVGTLRVTAPAGLASALVAPVCAAMMRKHTEVEVELIVDDRVRDLVTERIDVAIRMAPGVTSGYRSRKIADTQNVVVSAPGLVAAEHTSLPHLAAYTWVGHDAVTSSTYQIHDAKGVLHEFRPRVRGMSSSSEGQIALVEGRCGLALIPALLVSSAIEQGRLVRVFPSLSGRTIPVFAVTPIRTLRASRVVRFFELLAESEHGNTAPS